MQRGSNKFEKDYSQEIEESILTMLHELNTLSGDCEGKATFSEKQKKVSEKLENLSFSCVTREFFLHPEVKIYLANANSYLELAKYDDKIILWLLIGSFLTDRNNQLIKEELDKKLNHLANSRFWNNNLVPHYEEKLFPDLLTEISFIRNVYLTENLELINLFEKYLPAPHASLFDGYHVPTVIQAREQKSLKSLNRFVARNLQSDSTFDSLEASIIKIQRQFRSQRRRKEEIRRLKLYQGHIIQNALDSANEPFISIKWDKALLKRIKTASKKVKLFTSVRHLTTQNGLTSIFNDALYGRRTLLQSYIPFTKSALSYGDIRDGDFNVICFAPNNIDSKITNMHTGVVEIIFDFKKLLQQKNPCMFYKQRDFGFALNKMRKISLGEMELVFTHTNVLDLSNTPTVIDEFLKENPGFAAEIQENYSAENHVIFQLFKEGKLYAVASVHKVLLIGYDLNRMNQILTHNFFRFVDRLLELEFHQSLKTGADFNCSVAKNIYSELAKLSNEELTEFLQQIFLLLTDTCEVNLYGSHKIDFDSIKIITVNFESEEKRYALDLPKFLCSLQSGDLAALEETRINLPALFKSYRFIDYLLSKVTNQFIIAELLNDKNTCTIPPLLQLLEKADTYNLEESFSDDEFESLSINESSAKLPENETDHPAAPNITIFNTEHNEKSANTESTKMSLKRLTECLHSVETDNDMDKLKQTPASQIEGNESTIDSPSQLSHALSFSLFGVRNQQRIINIYSDGDLHKENTYQQG